MSEKKYVIFFNFYCPFVYVFKTAGQITIVPAASVKRLQYKTNLYVFVSRYYYSTVN